MPDRRPKDPNQVEGINGPVLRAESKERTTKDKRLMTKKRNYNLIFGIILSSFVVILLTVGVFWTPYNPDTMNASQRLKAPSAEHILGTDNFGRDIFSRVLKGGVSTLWISVSTVLVGLIFGVIVGAFTGYYGGITRSEFSRIKSLDYVKSAKLNGVPSLRIMFVHILPNTINTLLSTIAIGFNNAVLAEASLSFLGIGVQPPDPSLGRMLAESQTYLFSAPWYTLSAGGMIVLLILGFGLLSDGLGDIE